MENKLSKKEKTKRVFIAILILLLIFEIVAFSVYFKQYIYQKKVQKELDAYTNKIKYLEQIKNNDGIEKLNEINPDFVGWITCNDIKLSMPFVQSDTEEDKEFYLTHDFEKNSSPYGCPYVKFDCKLNKTSNTSLVGHSSFWNGPVVFSEFYDYYEKAYSNNFNFTINIETEENMFTYQVFSVFTFSPNKNYNDGYFVYNTTNFNSADDFEKFQNICNQYNVLNKENVVNINDKFLTIITCSKMDLAERLLIVSKLV